MPSIYCCVGNCWKGLGKRHSFPNPEKYSVLFDKWVNLCGNSRLKSEMTRNKIFKNCRVCSSHFKPEDFGPNERLKKGVLPSLLLPEPLEPIEEPTILNIIENIKQPSTSSQWIPAIPATSNNIVETPRASGSTVISTNKIMEVKQELKDVFNNEQKFEIEEHSLELPVMKNELFSIKQENNTEVHPDYFQQKCIKPESNISQNINSGDVKCNSTQLNCKKQPRRGKMNTEHNDFVWNEPSSSTSSKTNEDYVHSTSSSNVIEDISHCIKKPSQWQQTKSIPEPVSENPDFQLKTLLQSWNLEHILDHLKAEKVNIKVLKIIKRHHIEKLLKDFDMGTQITFEHNLELWRHQEDPNFPLDGFPSPACSEKSFSSQLSESQVSCCSTPDISEGNRILLSDILNESVKAQILIQYYEKFKMFQDEQRNSLIQLIAHYFEDKGITMSLATSFEIERQIIERFPTEKLDYYRTNNKRGKIYNKWRNLNSHLKCTVRQIKPKKAKISGKNSVIRYHEDIVPEEDAQSCIEALKYSNPSSEEFDSLWKACSNLRLHQIKTLNTTAVLEEWSFYKQSSGFRLIEMDFESAFKSKGYLLAEWRAEFPAMLSFLREEQHVKDKNIKLLLDQLMTETNQNGCDAALLWCLHGYMVPTNKIVKKDKFGKNTTTKFSIRDSQESFLYLARSIQKLETYVACLKEKKKSVQPFVYCIGENIFNIEAIGLFFEDIRYEFFNVLRAVDICFKIIYLFNLQFPPESIMPWSFIEQYFFRFKSNHHYAKVHVFCEYLKNKKNKEN